MDCWIEPYDPQYHSKICLSQNVMSQVYYGFIVIVSVSAILSLEIVGLTGKEWKDNVIYIYTERLQNQNYDDEFGIFMTTTTTTYKEYSALVLW